VSPLASSYSLLEFHLKYGRGRELHDHNLSLFNPAIRTTPIRLSEIIKRILFKYNFKYFTTTHQSFTVRIKQSAYVYIVINSYIFTCTCCLCSHREPNCFREFYILLTVHLDAILVNYQLDALFLNVFISCLYMFRAKSAHHQEGQLVLIHHLV
jgi:hypothetical protein